MAQVSQGKTPQGDAEFVKGCPLCEHTDPQLERELEDFARMLFEIMLADEKGGREDRRSGGVDKTP